MSQLEQDFRLLLSAKPEIGKCCQHGLINRRSLARYLIRIGMAKMIQFDAIVAMLRRYEFKKPSKEVMDIFRDIRVNIKDNIVVLDFDKNRELVHKLQRIISHTEYDKGDTLKIVIGSASVKLFIDKKNISKLKDLLYEFRPMKIEHITELSLMFQEQASSSRGVLAAITNEFVLNDINITEFLTATPELLIYLREEYVLKAYAIIKRLQKSGSER
jgi:hypothetical protein